MAWTPEQQQAIDLEGQNIIVSAGAGSGKTAVLTERVIRKLKSGIHINELLVLTFTNAAAAEMKERIRVAINNTKGLEEEAKLLDSAFITTFDSYSLAIVKRNHTYLNISKEIEPTDEVTIELEKKHLLDAIFEKYYLSLQPAFLKLINDFCLKDDKELKNLILAAYKKIELKYDKDEFLNTYITNYYTKENITKLVKEYLELIKDYQNIVKEKVERLNDYFDGSYVCKVEESLQQLIQALTYEEIKGALNIDFPRLPNKSPAEGKKLKKEITEAIDNIKKLTLYATTEEIYEEILQTKGTATILINILQELNKKLSEYKKQEEIYNFTDIAHLAVKVVATNPQIQEELKNSYNEILVDEYQDTSDIQELFISLIANNNVYMVGDIKQSIYRFRNANPYIFKNKYDVYSENKGGIKIDLLKNFRSRKEVLANINSMFDLFMDDEIGGANYQKSHRLVFGNTTYIEEGYTEQNYNLSALTYNINQLPITDEEQEAFLIGHDIEEKIADNYQVFDKNLKKLRPITYKDFAILLDKSKNFDLYKKIFEYLHIPLTILKDEALRKDQDILIIKNLLKLLIHIKEKNYDKEFEYSFFSIARSFLFKIPDDELYKIFINKSYQETRLFKKCETLLPTMDITTPATFLTSLLEEFNYEEKILTVGNVKSFLVRLEYFYNLVKNFENKGNTIYDFIAYLDELFENDYDLKFNINTSDSNSCKIMTIHKSKGLEFPICYFAGFKSKFNIRELNEKIIFDNNYGLVIPIVNNYYKDTIVKTLLKYTTKKEEISEKIRLFYVALTRAKEQLIMVFPEQEEPLETGFVSKEERLKYNSFLSIIKSIYSTILPFIKKPLMTASKNYLNINKELTLKKDASTIVTKVLNIESMKIEEAHYSKEELHLVTKDEQALLNIGTKVHSILEQLDFKNPKLDLFALDEHLKEKIKQFLQLPIIKENINYPMYKEYEFLFLQDNVTAHGIIDLLIERPDKMLIIDYKLKNITDAAYIKQLNGYREYIKQKTNKKVECFLYSILDADLKEIKEENLINV